MSGFVDAIGGPAGFGPLAVLVLFPLQLLLGALTGPARRTGAGRFGHRDRVELLSGVAWAAIGLVLGYLLLPWGAVPVGVWSACLVVAVVGAGLGVTEWRTMTWRAFGRRWLRVTGVAAVGSVATVGVLVTALLALRPA